MRNFLTIPFSCSILSACSIFPQEVTKNVDAITESADSTTTPVDVDLIDICKDSAAASTTVTVLPSVILIGSVTPAAKVPKIPAKRGRKSTVFPASVPAVKKTRIARSVKSMLESGSDVSSKNESQGESQRDEVSGTTSSGGTENTPSAFIETRTVSVAMSMETSSDVNPDIPPEIPEPLDYTVSVSESKVDDVCEKDITVNEAVVMDEVCEQDAASVTAVVTVVVEEKEKVSNEIKPSPASVESKVEPKRRKRTAAVMLNNPAKETETNISPEVAVKIKCHTERMAEMVAEVASLEK